MLKPHWVRHKGEKMWVPDGKIFYSSVKRMVNGDKTVLPQFRTTMSEEQALDRIFAAERRTGGVRPENEPEKVQIEAPSDPVSDLESIFGLEDPLEAVRRVFPGAKHLGRFKETPEPLSQVEPRSVKLL